MTAQEAASIIAILSAAYPWIEVREDTAAVYVEALAPLRYDVARRAAGTLIETSSRFPSVSEIRGVYRRLATSPEFAQPALEEPSLTPEQRRENLAKIRELADRIGGER